MDRKSSPDAPVGSLWLRNTTSGATTSGKTPAPALHVAPMPLVRRHVLPPSLVRYKRLRPPAQSSPTTTTRPCPGSENDARPRCMPAGTPEGVMSRHVWPKSSVTARRGRQISIGGRTRHLPSVATANESERTSRPMTARWVRMTAGFEGGGEADAVGADGDPACVSGGRGLSLAVHAVAKMNTTTSAHPRRARERCTFATPLGHVGA